MARCGFMVRDRKGHKVLTTTTKGLANQIARRLTRVDAKTRRLYRDDPEAIRKFTSGPFRVTRVCPVR
jgi:hypothetical protein